MSCVNHPAVTDGLVRCSRCSQRFCVNCIVRIGGKALCGPCKNKWVRDAQSGTGEGQLELASIGRRFGALWLDSILFTLLAGLSMFAPAFMGESAAGILDSSEPATGSSLFLWGVVLGTVVTWAIYEALMLRARGQTLGKMAAGIQVVTPDGDDLSTAQAWGRSAVRQLFFSYLSIINYLPAFVTKQRTCLHDLISKTRVVRVRR